jgi:hypothetical protein
VEFHPENLQPIHYLPILTTLFSAFFFVRIFGRYLQRGGPHLFWWATGVFTYGLGTLLESLITLFGNGPMMNKLWYAAGAILGGYPLAQGSVYLHLTRRKANLLTAITGTVVIIAIVLVLASPVNSEALESFRPGGAALGWQWVRLLSPFINSYSAVFLIGTALWSAIRYAAVEGGKYRALGNALITVGAILPGIGGAMAKAGVVEALYIGEFVGILLIYAGYRTCMLTPALATAAPVPARG